jgi:tnpV protein
VRKEILHDCNHHPRKESAMKSAFEAMGGTYRQCGDFFIPEIALPDTPENSLGKYGRMCHRYLKEHRRVLYNAMILDGTLWSHLTP